jgi:hypothetical protein
VPDIPWLDVEAPVTLTPCRPGWREVEVDGQVECDAYPEGGPEECGAGEAHFVGEPGCRPVGDPCPTGRFADAVSAGEASVYVDGSAAPGGDGSFSAPLSSLSQVSWTSLSTGDVVALAKGSYDGTLPLRAGVTVVGACARDTILTGVDAPVPAVITSSSSGEPAVVRNLTISDAPQLGAVVRSGRALSLEGVVVSGTLGGAVVSLEGAHLGLTDVVLSDVVASAGIGGYAIQVMGASLAAERVVVRRAAVVAVALISPETEVEMRDVAISSTEPDSSGQLGRGIFASGGAQLTASGLYFRDNHSLNIDATGEGTTIVLEDSLLANTLSTGRDGGGGINLEDGAELTATRTTVAETMDNALFAETGASLLLQDVLIRDAEPRPSTLLLGRGIELRANAQLVANRVLVTRAHEIGVFVDEGSTAEVTDLQISDVAARPSDSAAGVGIVVSEGARLTATRLLCERTHTGGVLVSDSGSRADLTDTVIRDVYVAENTSKGGRGIQVQLGAELGGQRVRVERVAEFGIAAVDGTTAELSDLVISNVTTAPCAASGCRRFAHGMAALSSTLDVARFTVEDIALCGVFVGYAGLGMVAPEADFETGRISHAEIGACINLDEYDTARLSRDVDYVDNQTNLESTSLPVPDVVNALP